MIHEVDIKVELEGKINLFCWNKIKSSPGLIKRDQIQVQAVLDNIIYV